MATVLIASLGDSPVVVTAMFDLLQKKGKAIDRLEVFYPETEFALTSYEDLIHKALQKKCEEDNITCEVKGIPFLDESAGAEYATFDFLHKLAQNLGDHQEKKGDSVYLSLAGGRKSMAALMALLAPLFLCVEELYHILDKDEDKEGHFLSTRKLYTQSEANQQRLLFPSHERIALLSIPYGEEQQMTPEDKARLFALTEEQVDEMWDRDPERARAEKSYKDRLPEGMMSVELTKEVAEQYYEMLRSDSIHGKRFGICFEQMRFKDYRFRFAHREPHSYKGRNFHFYKRPGTDERPVFHIETIGTDANTGAKIQKVVVSALPIEVQGRAEAYPPLKKLVKHLKFPLQTVKLEDIHLPKEEGVEEAKKHILIIPLATSPMVATQLYQLYINRGDEVHSVILVHTIHKAVRDSVEIVREAFNDIGVTCKAVPLEGYNDIDTPEACTAYQELLEQTIQTTRQKNSSCQIDLTISGGRKGMAALATFAAQRQKIRRVVHTVIHEQISDRVYEETKVRELQKLKNMNSMKKRNDRLFLRAYQDDIDALAKDGIDAFVLFTVPVIPVQKG